MYLKSINDYSSALKISPKDSETYYRRGISYKALNKIDEACLDFQQSADLGYIPAIKEKNNSCSK